MSHDAGYCSGRAADAGSIVTEYFIGQECYPLLTTHVAPALQTLIASFDFIALS